MFWAAFDMPMTVVPLKVALGWNKFDFWAFQQNNHDEMPKNLSFANPKATFNHATTKIESKAAQNNLTPHLK